MSTTSDMRKMIEEYVASWATHDAEKIASFLADDCVFEDVALGTVAHGKEEFKVSARGIFATITDFKEELTSIFIGEDWACIESVLSGTQTATGKSYAVRMASVVELKDGKIKRNSDYWDMASMMKQVGLMP